MTVRERDNGANALLRRMREQATVKVGVIGDEAEASKKVKVRGKPKGRRKKGRGKKGKFKVILTGNTVVEIATIHEFGMGVPERSFIRAFVDENEALIKKKIRTLGKKIVKGTLSSKQALDILGVWLTGKIQSRIAKGIPPALAQATIDRKGSSKPLINTGQLRSSITHETDVRRG